jgi:Protein of unknown function (DUF2634).
MIPRTNDNLLPDFQFAELPTRTYRIHIDENYISGHIDNLSALAQAIYLVLNIERYDYLIYSWNYGVEFKNLIGRNTSYVIPEVKRRIIEALSQDARIRRVDDFRFESDSNKLHVIFMVTSIYGEISIDKELII